MESKKKTSIGSRIVERLQGFAGSLKKPEKMTERYTCRTIRLDVTSTHYRPEMVRETREMLGISQTLFAHFLGVSLRTVRAWEQGAATPTQLASRFLDEIRVNPDYWRQRLQDLAVVK
jgi:putative transcriptional regulator